MSATFEERVVKKMQELLEKEEEAAVEAEALKRIDILKCNNAIAERNIEYLKKQLGYCWNCIDESYPYLNTACIQYAIDHSEENCAHCKSLSASKYKEVRMSARAALINICKQKKDAADREREEETKNLPIYNKYNSIIAELLQQRINSNNYTKPIDMQIYTILTKDYPETLAKTYYIQIPLLGNLIQEISFKNCNPSSVAKIVMEYIKFEKHHANKTI
jgi:hypothetical protein